MKTRATFVLAFVLAKVAVLCGYVALPFELVGEASLHAAQRLYARAFADVLGSNAAFRAAVGMDVDDVGRIERAAAMADAARVRVDDDDDDDDDDDHSPSGDL